MFSRATRDSPVTARVPSACHERCYAYDSAIRIRPRSVPEPVSYGPQVTNPLHSGGPDCIMMAIANAGIDRHYDSRSKLRGYPESSRPKTGHGSPTRQRGQRVDSLKKHTPRLRVGLRYEKNPGKLSRQPLNTPLFRRKSHV